MIDPLENLQIDVQSYDLKRACSVYCDNAGEKWWTTAWFNGREKEEQSIEISRRLAIEFIQNRISKDDWLMRFYPKQMNSYFNAIEQARKQVLGI